MATIGFAGLGLMGTGFPRRLRASGAGGPRDKVVVDFSTSEMETTKRLAEGLRQAGIAFPDAPVSGGPPAAEAGTLAIMVGVETAALEKASPMLQSLHRRRGAAAGAGRRCREDPARGGTGDAADARQARQPIQRAPRSPPQQG